jgi:hypothetical protein
MQELIMEIFVWIINHDVNMHEKINIICKYRDL